jgi:hypothetical protein
MKPSLDDGFAILNASRAQISPGTAPAMIIASTVGSGIGVGVPGVVSAKTGCVWSLNVIYGPPLTLAAYDPK